MDAMRQHHLPKLRRPIAIMAFGGWNDACDVASTSADFIVDAHSNPDVFAEIEPDDIYDFQQQRPTISIKDGVAKSLRWPTIKLTALPRPDDSRDLVIVSGSEPNFHWKTVARSIVDTLDEIGVEDAILLGAYVGAVSHRDQVHLSGVGSDAVTVIRSGLNSANYEGPTGMVGVIQGACREVGIPSLSVWAPTPPYLGGNPFPRAVLAMVERISDLTNLHIDTSELIAVDAEYTERVDDALEDADSELSEFIEELENYDEPVLGSLANYRSDSDERLIPKLDPEHAELLMEEIADFLDGKN